jgi:hypothetical protein
MAGTEAICRSVIPVCFFNPAQSSNQQRQPTLVTGFLEVYAPTSGSVQDHIRHDSSIWSDCLWQTAEKLE